MSITATIEYQKLFFSSIETIIFLGGRHMGSNNLAEVLIKAANADAPEFDGRVVVGKLAYDWTVHRSNDTVQVTAISERTGILGSKYFALIDREVWTERDLCSYRWAVGDWQDDMVHREEQ